MNTESKIVLIGAGSAVFTRGLVADLILHGKPRHLALVDIDPEALDTARLLVKRMLAARPAPVTVSAHTDRREALPGADYVVTTIAVGGRRAWEQDVFIPRRYGIFQPVGDTIMPGGISRALRQVPAMVGIARDVQELAPDAWLFNYANPMAAICRALNLATDARIVGLCHGVHDGERHVAKLLGVERERCGFRALGMNHLAFFTEMTVDGEDARPVLQEVLANAGQDPGESLRHYLFERFGTWSVLHDRHLAEFYPQFLRTHPGGKLGVDLFSFEKTISNGDRGYAAMAAQARGEAPLDEGIFSRTVGEHEQLVQIIDALEGGPEAVFSVNVPNAGQCPDLPEGLVLECPARISSAGVEPEPCAAPHPFARESVARALGVIELAVQAALGRDREMFEAAIVADGAAESAADACELAGELWQSNEPYSAV